MVCVHSGTLGKSLKVVRCYPAFFFFFGHCTAYGSSQARGQIGANTRSEPRL